MPIEIKELVIRAVVDSETGDKKPCALTKERERKTMIQDCVDATLKVLRAAQER